MRAKINNLKSGDFILLVATLVLVVFGIIMVFSASYYQSINEDGTPYAYLIRELIWAIAGLAGMLIMAVVDYRRYKNFAPYILGISFILLVLLIIPGVGTEINYAVRWITIGPITIMPGEIAKPAMILFVAWFLGDKPERIHNFVKGLLPLFAICGAFCFMIIKQPNLSTAITLAGIVFLMMFVAGMNWKPFVGTIGAGIAGVMGIIIMNPDSHWASRFTSFLDPFADPLGEGFQVVQSLMALGSGGLFGLGLGKSIQKNLYLPEPQNDFILAIIGEELGFIGVLCLIAVYLVFIWRGVHIALNAPDHFSMLLASGIVIMVALQVVLNIAVVTSSMPATGVILPFVSYGGNALLIFMGSAGVLLNISRHVAKVD